MLLTGDSPRVGKMSRHLHERSGERRLDASQPPRVLTSGLLLNPRPWGANYLGPEQADEQQAVFDVAAPKGTPKAPLHHQGRAAVSGVSGRPEISQSEAPAAFHSAVNDGARCLICLIFRSKPFPQTAPMAAGTEPIVSPQFQGK